MSSTFEGLYIARSGVQAARANLNVTGQNISNANTVGYTRQRVDQSAIPPSAIRMMYAASGAINGEGVMASGISQLRNPFLDSQFRTQNAKCGSSSTLLNAMSDIEDILNESTTDGLSAQFANLITQLQGLTSSGSGSATESTVKNAASLLATFFNTASSELDTVQKQQLGYLQDYASGQANKLMRDIASLNEQIKSANIAGTPALELLDQRNSMIDELSQYANIKVTEKDTGSASVKGQPVNDLEITLVDAKGDPIQARNSDGTLKTDGDGNPVPVTLVSNDQYVQFDVNVGEAEDPSPYGEVSMTVSELSADSTKSDYNDMQDSDFSTGEISGYLQLLNQSGDFDGTSTKGIGYYKQVLNEAAQKFADLMNKANSTNEAGDNKPLFTESDGTTDNITAANITVASAWTSGYLTTTKSTPNAGDDNSSGTDNIEYMISQLTGKDTVQITAGGKVIFSGSMQGAVDDISLKLGQDIDSLASQDNANANTLTNIDNARLELSSVDINEEAINLIQYNQSLSASARFMTTMDEVLDTIINGMGIAGR
jgi:flagellar hook-associated protein 1 FlgK